MTNDDLTPVELSRDTWRLIQAVFPPEEHEEVARLLVEECGNNLPFLEKSDAKSLERFRFAALKLSQGDIDKLLEAVVLAQIDWRDLLVAAGFGYSVEAHAIWAKAILDT
jgi:hypothetical protein